MMPLLIESITIIAPEADAINGLQRDDADVDIYDLCGRKVDSTNLRTGIYIKKVKKIVIR
jgi:hypothetical protein